MVNKIFGSIQSFNFHDSIQYLEYWFSPIPKILIQSNTSNIDSIQYLKYWCNLPGPSAANRNESNWALESTENIAGEGELDLEVEFPKFLADILDKTQGSKLTFSFGSQLASNGKILVARS